MTAARTEPSPQAPAAAPAPTPETRPAPALYLSELVVGLVVVWLALIAWAGLALAHLGHYKLGTALALSIAGTLLVVAVTWITGRVRSGAGAARPRLALDTDGLMMVAGLAVVAALLFFPGSSYGIGDKDPGAYVNHGISIARTGSYSIKDPTLDTARVPYVALYSPGARFPAEWINSVSAHLIVPQFYHLWPAALASAYAAFGFHGVANLTPLCGVLAVLLLALAVRRAFGARFGTLAGALTGLLLAANMLEVWHAKYPTTEMFTQMLLAGALLGVVVALRTGWRPAAGIAGLLLGISYLARPDSVLLVLLAVGVGCVLIAAGRFDGRAGAFAIGLGVTVPHALYQAYHTAERYTLSNNIPKLRTLAVVVAVPILAAFALRRFAPGFGRRVVSWLECRRPSVQASEAMPSTGGRGRRLQVALGLAIVGVAGVLMVVGFLRPRLFGANYFNWNGQILRSYDEQSLRRLSWFLTLPGFALMGAGLALLALRRWRAAAWALVVPALCLFPIYAWHADNSSRLMWWSRRYVPVVLPGLIVLIVVALATGLTLTAWRRGWRPPAWGVWAVRAAAGAATLGLLAVFLGQSLPLRHHHEMDGSFQLTQQIAAVSGNHQGVFLWQKANHPLLPAALFGAGVWMQQGQVSAMLPGTTDPGYVRAFEQGFPGQPVYLVWSGAGPPPDYQQRGISLRQVLRIQTNLPMWDESDTMRPAASHTIPVDLSVWQVVGT